VRARSVLAFTGLVAVVAPWSPTSADSRAGASDRPAAESVTALVNATMLDGTGQPARSRVTIVVRGRRIASIAERGAALPPDARVVDLAGQFVIPGLIDAHVHLGTQPRPPEVLDGVLRSVFLGGITTVRDMGGSLRTVRPLAMRSSDESIPTPRIYSSAILAGPGRWFTGPFGENAAGGLPIGTSPVVRMITDSTNPAAVIRDAAAAGVTGIKIYNTVSPAMIRALALEAHRHHLRVWSHLSVDPGRPSDLVLAGVDVVSHGDQFRAELGTTVPAPASDSRSRAQRDREYAAMSPDDARLGTLLARMRQAGTMLDPTLFIMLPREATPGMSAAEHEHLLRSFRFAAAMTRRAARAGIPIVAGTDAIGGSSANLHAELQLLVDSAGLTPLQALRAAGLDAARAIGVQDSLGSIAPGKLADLVVLRRDPSASIRNTQTVVMVIKGGRIYPRTTPMRPGPLAAPPPS
jgi:hypothetical protein